MIAVVQRVRKAAVKIEGDTYSQISLGYLILLGIFGQDGEEEVKKLSEKIINLRIMADDQGKMNLSLKQVKGEVLVVSQFTLCADLNYGRRPSFIRAKKPAEAEKLYNVFVDQIKKSGIVVKTGKFGQYMEVQLTNDGPVTIIIDSEQI